MKNLRKVLAVVLVVAMAFSFAVVASAKQITDYSDASSVKYTEAVDLMAGLGIMTGSGGTTFDPTGTFTREMAAKVICYILLGKTVSDSLTTATSSFSDVSAARWSAPYIEYCAAAGIINGRGDGTFAPEAPITGSAMAKLLLCAIGYGAKGEFTGANWEIQSLVKAQTLGILDTGVNYSASATREQVAKYVFNVLTKAACGVTAYNTTTGTYNAAGATLGTTTFGLTNVASTSNGVASHKYTALVAGVTTVVSGIFNDDNVIATSTNGATATQLTTLGNAYYKAGLDTSPAATFFNNGAALADLAAADAVIVSGSVVKLIDNDRDGLADKVLITNKTVDFVTAAVSVAANGTVTIPGVGTYVKDTVVYPELALGDVVLKYTDNTGITHIEKAAAITGTMTAKNATGAAVFAGVVHAQSALTGTTALAGFTTYNAPATIWVDDNGNVVHFLVTDASASANYVVLISEATSGFTVQGLVVDTTGAAKIVTISTVDGVAATGAETANKFYSYIVNSDGSYALYSATNTNTADAAISNVALFDGTHVGDSTTKFIVPNTLLGGTSGYTVYTGVANAPAFDATTDTNAMIFNGVAKYVFIYSGVSAAAPTTNNVYFVNAAAYTHVAATATTPEYYEFAAIVNGSATTVKLTAAGFATVSTGLFGVKYDSNGYIYDANDAVTGKATGTAVTSAANGTVILGGGTYTYDANTVVYYISALGVVTKGTMADLVVDADDTYTTYLTASTLDAADLLSAIYVQVV